MKLFFIIIIVFIALFFSFFNYKIQENLFINDRNQKIIIEFPSFIINLKETDEGKRRLPIIKSIFPNAKRFPATYGKTFDFKPYLDLVLTLKWDIGKWKRQSSKMIDMTDGEKGIIMSHYNLWTKIAKSNKPHLILEDDAIGINENTSNILDIILKNLPHDYDMYLLGYIDLKPDNIIGYNSKVKEFVLLHSYLITPTGAKKLLNNLPINMPVDSWISSISDKINIYRHNYGNFSKKNRFYGKLIGQIRNEKQIVNTNII